MRPHRHRCWNCDGKGWFWVGSVDNAERVQCDMCQAKRKSWLRLNWDGVVGLGLVLASAVVSMWLIVYALIEIFG